MVPFALSREAIKIANSTGIPVTAGFHCQAENFTKHFFLYAPSSLLWNILAMLFYYVIAFPIVFIISKLFLELKIVNRHSISKVKDTGFFLYGNHTRYLDAFLPAMIYFRKKAYIIANADASSIRGLKNIVKMLGCLPIPNDINMFTNFLKAIHKQITQKSAVATFPRSAYMAILYKDTSLRLNLV